MVEKYNKRENVEMNEIQNYRNGNEIMKLVTRNYNIWLPLAESKNQLLEWVWNVMLLSSVPFVVHRIHNNYSVYQAFLCKHVASWWK